MTNLEPETLIRNFLRSHLTDHNGSRVGSNWVYDDDVRTDLVPNSFPRVVVQKVVESGRIIGVGENITYDEIISQMDVLVHRQLGVVSIVHTDEVVGVISNSARINVDYLAHTVTNVKHDAVAFGTVTAVVNDSDFTSPGSLATDEVEWSKSTGNFNFSTQDLSDHNGESITSTYTEKLEGEQLCKRVSRDIVVAIRNNWRSDEFLNDLSNPEKLGVTPARFDIDKRWHRYVVEYRWRRHNVGEEI